MNAPVFDLVTFQLFRVVCNLAGIFLAIGVALWAVQWAMQQVMVTATLIEAAAEALRQGRQPILRTWLRRSKGGHDDWK